MTFFVSNEIVMARHKFCLELQLFDINLSEYSQAEFNSELDLAGYQAGISIV
jgi:hypothetical protein